MERVMNRINAGMHQSRYARDPHPVLFIDGVPLGMWASGVIHTKDGEDDSDSLVPAQGWLMDEGDLENAWHLLTPKDQRASTVVPILVCPDDMDMNCTVAVVEQLTDDESVSWARLGRALDVINRVVTSVEWIDPAQSAHFSREEFTSAVCELKRLTVEVWK